jgi:S-adenosyl methyltransferase
VRPAGSHKQGRAPNPNNELRWECVVARQADWIPDSADPELPSPARMYDYILGGAHNFAADRALVEKGLEVDPNTRRVAIVNRAFLRRAVLS